MATRTNDLPLELRHRVGLSTDLRHRSMRGEALTEAERLVILEDLVAELSRMVGALATQVLDEGLIWDRWGSDGKGRWLQLDVKIEGDDG